MTWQALSPVDEEEDLEAISRPVKYFEVFDGNMEVDFDQANPRHLKLSGSGEAAIGALHRIDTAFCVNKVTWTWRVSQLAAQDNSGREKDQPLHVIAILENPFDVDDMPRAVGLTWCVDYPKQTDTRKEQSSYDSWKISDIPDTQVHIETTLLEREPTAVPEPVTFDLNEAVAKHYPGWKDWNHKVFAIVVFADTNDAGGTFKSEIWDITLSE